MSEGIVKDDIGRGFMVHRHMPVLKRLRLEQEAITFGVVVLLAIGLILGTSAFMDFNNLDSLQTAIIPNLMIAIGMMVLFVTGLFDLSVGAVMGLAGIVTALGMQHGFGLPASVLFGLGVGVGIGVVNGLLVAYAGINHLIVTLGVMYMTRGIIEVLLKGEGVAGFTNYPDAFLAVGNLKLGGFYDVFLLMLAVTVLMELLLRKTRLCRSLYFTGGNLEAAKLIGLNTRRIQLGAFVFSGFMAAFAGLFSTARMGMANRYLGTGIEMNIIIACLVGGGSIAGGKGSIIGAFLGVVFISLLTDAFNLFEVPAEWQSSVVGAILVAVVVFDGVMILRKQRRSWRSILGIKPRAIAA